ncbi:mannose-1-phosphate guanylyltransferase [bacterium]|nr:MAG: mannose-1-phosphate guanylyltransferase [bacterium]
MYAVILAGGRGKRFWPVSISKKPKQFVDIDGTDSMLASTFRRISSFIDKDEIIILTQEGMVDQVVEAIPGFDRARVFAEPVGRNTGPSIAAASILIRKFAGDVPFITCPADHMIDNVEMFVKASRYAGRLASENDVLVTFGIKPKFAATGYGYIETGDTFLSDELDSFRVKSFHEKPDADTASRYLEAGNFFWNSGIFVWRPSVFLDSVARYMPDALVVLNHLEEAIDRGDFDKVFRKEYEKMPSISVDYGVLEKADNVVTLPVDLGWSDVGSWDALYELLARDENGNAGRGDYLSVGSKGNLLFNPDGFVASIDVDDVIVAVLGGAVLVCKRGSSQKVKELVELMEKRGLNRFL